MIDIAPFTRNPTIPAATRQTFLSDRFSRPVFLGMFRSTVAINSQFLVRVSLWEVFTDAIANNVIPSGRNFLQEGTGDGWVTDDGESGLIPFAINKWALAGCRLAVSFDNTDPAANQPVYATVDLKADAVQELTYA